MGKKKSKKKAKKQKYAKMHLKLVIPPDVQVKDTSVILQEQHNIDELRLPGTDTYPEDDE